VCVCVCVYVCVEYIYNFYACLAELFSNRTASRAAHGRVQAAKPAAKPKSLFDDDDDESNELFVRHLHIA
jgi:hypothetical protein